MLTPAKKTKSASLRLGKTKRSSSASSRSGSAKGRTRTTPPPPALKKKEARIEALVRGPSVAKQMNTFGCNVSDEEAMALYHAVPFAFSTSPIGMDTSPNDSKTVRGTLRTRVSELITVNAGSTAFFCPSPLTPGIGASGSSAPQAIGGWIGGWANAVEPGGNDPWKNGPTLGAGYTNHPIRFIGRQDTIAGAIGSPLSLCGGVFCANVMVPYNGACNVFNFGPSDASNVQGIGAGDRYHQHPCFSAAGFPTLGNQLPANPRRQYVSHAYFHMQNTRDTIAAAVDPVMLVGSSMNANQTFGFALVDDAQFSPIDIVGPVLAGGFTSPDLYPYDNPSSGLLNGQGCIYVENTGSVPIQVVAEMYADFCVGVGLEAQAYLSNDTLAYGMDGSPMPRQAGVTFPGLHSSNCESLMHSIAIHRIPKHLRNERVDECLRKLIKQHVSTAQQVQSKTFKVIPMDPTPRGAFAKSLSGYIASGAKWISERVGDFKTIGAGIADVTRAAAAFMG